MGLNSSQACKQVTDRAFVALATAALLTNFLWFEVVERTACLGFSAQDGTTRDTTYLTLFLVGMGLVGALGCTVPGWLLKRWRSLAPWCATAGLLAAVAVAWAPSEAPYPAAFIATGVANVAFLLVDTVLLAYIADRRVMSMSVIMVFVLRTALLYCLDMAPAVACRAAATLLPIACALCSMLAASKIGSRDQLSFSSHVRLKAPASHTMVTLLVLAAVIYAVTASTMTFDYWQPGLFAGIHPLPFLAGTAVFLLVCHFTLVATRADFLMRFLPGLFVLLAANVVMGASGAGLVSLGEPAGTVAGLFVEMYCESFAWLLMLYAARMLSIAPLRLVGIFLFVEASVEGALYATQTGPSSLTSVMLMILLVVLALIWNLHQLYQLNARSEQAPCSTCPYRQAAHKTGPEVRQQDEAPSPPNRSETFTEDRRRALARAHDLSARETDVFVLLAQGYSRRYIGDELFISYGTVSTHTSRIYEKFGVHSKQELLALVNEVS